MAFDKIGKWRRGIILEFGAVSVYEAFITFGA